MTAPRFHLAIPVDDLSAARRFYGEILGCAEGRSAARWIDFDFRGHQLTAHLVDREPPAGATNPVDGHEIPVRHFGLILDRAEWDDLARRLAEGGARFLVEPTTRFQGDVGEQATLFVADPAGNVLELKSFRDESEIFRPA